MLNELSQKAYEAAKEKGFYDEPVQIGTRLMLIVSEVAEALEADRKDNYSDFDFEVLSRQSDESYKQNFETQVKNTFEDEIADTFIRLFDLCGYMNIDIEKHIVMKMRYNSLRPHKHGKEY